VLLATKINYRYSGAIDGLRAQAGGSYQHQPCEAFKNFPGNYDQSTGLRLSAADHVFTPTARKIITRPTPNTERDAITSHI
jgi:hypothetical protein